MSMQNISTGLGKINFPPKLIIMTFSESVGLIKIVIYNIFMLALKLSCNGCCRRYAVQYMF